MNNGMTHECNKKPGYVSIEKEEDSIWMICIEDYGDWIPIHYCPFCGDELEVET